MQKKKDQQQKPSTRSALLELVIGLGSQAAIICLAYLDIAQNGWEQMRLVTLFTIAEVVVLSVVFAIHMLLKRPRR